MLQSDSTSGVALSWDFGVFNPLEFAVLDAEPTMLDAESLSSYLAFIDPDLEASLSALLEMSW